MHAPAALVETSKLALRVGAKAPDKENIVCSMEIAVPLKRAGTTDVLTLVNTADLAKAVALTSNPKITKGTAAWIRTDFAKSSSRELPGTTTDWQR
mmetsp:Transcript_113920/g.317226  ORF Transcript_113920/g.317226 Transcript_113920/m.317226 type:complete len:96 (-) Transcript_113920:939-1226(-)